MVLARAGNWEMKNIFYYLTNHLNNSQCFCSEFRGAQPAGTNRAVLSRHPRWLIKRAGVGLRGCLCRWFFESRKGVKTQSTSTHGAVGQGCLPDGCLPAARVLCGDRCQTASLRPSPAQSRPRAPETEAGPDELRGSGCRVGGARLWSTPTAQRVGAAGMSHVPLRSHQCPRWLVFTALSWALLVKYRCERQMVLNELPLS